MAQGLSALQHASEDNLDAAWRADALDPAVGSFALAVVGLILVPTRFCADLLVVPGRRRAGTNACGLEGEMASKRQLQGT